MAGRIQAYLAATVTVLLFCGVARAQDHPLVDEHAWIPAFTNSQGVGCCGKDDTFLLTHAEASGLDIGSRVTVTTKWDYELTITVDSIYLTQDPLGRPWITRYGCLFISPGS